MHKLATKLFPICRSITGEGFRQSLDILNDELGGALNIHEIPSGTKVFDWIIPDEWNIRDAYIITPDGKKICDFKENNLHIMGYSEAVNCKLSLEELNKHLYSLPSLPEAIPYITSYYKRRFGFCISENERKKLKNGVYKVFIDASHNPKGVLNYADMIIPASREKKDEILISSYLCHPSMANNELSGPVVATFLAKWLKNRLKEGVKLKFNYRFIFIPETIGSITYLSKNLKILQNNVKAGFNLSCVGDELAYSLIHSHLQNTIADKIAKFVLEKKENFKEYDYLDSGSDERQYCSPLVNLPVVGICRSIYGGFKEYHTSLDDLNFITQKGLEGSLNVMKEIIKLLELNEIYISNVYCEPNLGKRGLYPTVSSASNDPSAYFYRKFLALCDGKRDCIDIAKKLNLDSNLIKKITKALLENDLIRKIN